MSWRIFYNLNDFGITGLFLSRLQLTKARHMNNVYGVIRVLIFASGFQVYVYFITKHKQTKQHILQNSC